MTEVPAAPDQQAPQETDAQKVVRAQRIIDTFRQRLADETDRSVGLESRVSILEEQLAQEQQIRVSMSDEIVRLRGLLPEDLLSGEPIEQKPESIEDLVEDKSDDSRDEAADDDADA